MTKDLDVLQEVLAPDPRVPHWVYPHVERLRDALADARNETERAIELDEMRERSISHFRRQRDDLAEQLRWALDYIESLRHTGAAFDSIAKARKSLRDNSALDLDERGS